MEFHPAIFFRQHVDFGRGLDLDIENDGDQRQPWLEIGRPGGDHLSYYGPRSPVGIVAAESEHFAQQLAPHHVRVEAV